MANKERNKRAARKARQAERQRAEAQTLAQKQTPAAPAKDTSTKAVKKSGKPGFFQRVRNYFGDVRSEIRRVSWPTPADLKSYTVAVIVILVIFGVATWLIDSGVVAALIGFSGLRG